MNTPAQAVEVERQRATSGYQGPEGNCLGNTRDCYGSPASGGTAATAYAATVDRHGIYDTPPLGALVWFTGGSKGAGHVGISNGEGYFWNTDFGLNGYIGDGRIRLVLISAIHQHDSLLKYVGWTEDLDGENVMAQFTDAQAQALLEILSALGHYGTAWGKTDADRVFGFVKAAAGHVQAPATATSSGVPAHTHTLHATVTGTAS